MSLLLIYFIKKYWAHLEVLLKINFVPRLEVIFFYPTKVAE